jgi:hypothetical protein
VFNANAAVPRKRHWYTSDSAKLTLAIIISSVASFCIAVAFLARSRLAPSHSLPWDSVKLLDVISIGKLGVTFKARYRGLLVSLKVTPLASAVHECQNESHSPCVLCSLPEPHPHHGAALSTLLSSAPLLSRPWVVVFRAQPLFPPPLPQDGVEKHKSGMFAARCFNLMSRKSSPAHRQFPINDLEAAAVRPITAAKCERFSKPGVCHPGQHNPHFSRLLLTAISLWDRWVRS